MRRRGYEAARAVSNSPTNCPSPDQSASFQTLALVRVLVFGHGDQPGRLRLDPFRPDPADLLQAEHCINDWLRTHSGR